MYVLFYSKKCKYSEHFLQILTDAKEDKFFKKVCVDKINGKRPDYVKKYKITEVPTIMVDGQLHVGTSCFKWLKVRIQNMKNSINSHDTRVNKPKPQLNQITGFTPDNSSALLSGESMFDGNSQYCSLEHVGSLIPTPAEGSEIEKSNFILPGDNITGTDQIIKDSRPDKMSQMEKDFEKIKLARNSQDSRYKSPM